MTEADMERTSMHIDFEPLRRSYRNWHRKRRRVLPPVLPAPFHYVEDISALHEYFSTHEPGLDRLKDPIQLLHGVCFICSAEVDFLVKQPLDGSPVNWRETLACPNCGLINRWRSCLHLFGSICQPTALDRIYLTETLSPVYQQLADHYPLLSSSEFLPQAELGDQVDMHSVSVRNEDVTRLTFADRSFDAVLCFDVLEHVPDYRRALKEFYRVLDSGGQLVISVPFSHQQATIVRAVVDDAGEIEHLMEPCYHGDPLSADGVLSYYDFGMDLLEEMKTAGFHESFLVCYCSDHWGYLMNNVAFVARRLKR
jgi:SAM-dependent methyltransferase